MEKVNRGHLDGLELALSELDIDGAAAVKLLGMIAQASAAPEQEAVAVWLKSKDHAVYPDICILGNPADIAEGAFDTKIPLYTHADDGEVGRLRAELVESDKCVVRALNEVDSKQRTIDGINEAHWRVVQQLAAAQAMLRDVAELDPRGEFLGWKLDGEIYAFLSATAQPAECGHAKTHYSSRDGGAHVCSDCGGSQQGGSAQPADGVKSDA